MHYVMTCLLALAFALPGAAQANAASIDGTWKGDGSAKLKSGKVEPVRCTMRYEESSGRTFVIHVTCAHANGTFKVSGRVVRLSDSQYSGRLYSDQYSVAGDVTINVSGARQTLRADSPKGTAEVNLTKQ